jgi:outer membrane lipoprotein SlyB
MKHISRFPIAACLLVLTASLAACAGSSLHERRGEQSLRHGTVADVQPVTVRGEEQLGLGAEVGASAGGLIGNQAGGGTRRDLVTVLAAMGGGPLPDGASEPFEKPRDGQRIVVRLENGVGIAVTQEAEPELQVGESVRVEGRGAQARVLRR